MILLIDNYDSFTYNLAQYLSAFTTVEVVKNDSPELSEKAHQAQALVFSPGPGWPKDAGQMEELIRRFADKKPILGICLGHQAIAEVFGAKVRLARQVMHGKQGQVTLVAPSRLFEGVSSEFTVMRYHSLAVDKLTESFKVTAISHPDREVMAFEHRDLPIYAVQYHPESIGTPDGMRMIENFISIVNENTLMDLPSEGHEEVL